MKIFILLMLILSHGWVLADTTEENSQAKEVCILIDSEGAESLFLKGDLSEEEQLMLHYVMQELAVNMKAIQEEGRTTYLSGHDFEAEMEVLEETEDSVVYYIPSLTDINQPTRKICLLRQSDL